MEPTPQIIVTGDGSHSLLNTRLNETYHSVHGALRESRHVFIENGIRFWSEADTKPAIDVFEVGFGTGLNAVLTLGFANSSQRKVHYTSIEAFPLAAEVWSELNYAAELRMEDEFRALHQCEWNRVVAVSENFHLLKMETTLQGMVLGEAHFDVVYYDAFAPSKQPEMWSIDVLSKVVAGLRAGGVFVTYCAKGQLKRDLRSLGLEVESLPGPPGKKEMVRARK